MSLVSFRPMPVGVIKVASSHRILPSSHPSLRSNLYESGGPTTRAEVTMEAFFRSALRIFVSGTPFPIRMASPTVCSQQHRIVRAGYLARFCPSCQLEHGIYTGRDLEFVLRGVQPRILCS
jgi:hypothetical protein